MRCRYILFLLICALFTGCSTTTLPRKLPLTPVNHLSHHTHTLLLPENVKWLSTYSEVDPYISLKDGSFSFEIFEGKPLIVHGLSAQSYKSHQRYLGIRSGSLIFKQGQRISLSQLEDKIDSIFDRITSFNKTATRIKKRIFRVNGGTCVTEGLEFPKSYSYGYSGSILEADYYTWSKIYMFCKSGDEPHLISWLEFNEHRAPEQSAMIHSVFDKVLATLKLY